MQYKSTRKPLPEIARALNVAAIVEGSSFRAGNRVRITVQLVDGRSDVHLWAQSFERNLDNVLSLQAEVAEAVARAVGLRLTAGEQGKLLHRHTNVPAAYDAYLRGRYRWTTKTRRGLQDNIMYFEQAIAADPGLRSASSGTEVRDKEPCHACGRPSGPNTECVCRCPRYQLSRIVWYATCT
jgi:hypothetical protein